MRLRHKPIGAYPDAGDGTEQIHPSKPIGFLAATRRGDSLIDARAEPPKSAHPAL
ncbi:hypothetical protein [Mycobacterium sp. URHD0025]|uniref:hypothetical protein n=1 Tax=Mycobacterium sp. URHD0025 TaxID=1298864 RepID=UPI0003F58DBD|nr:hypothetical protein [Mycobacterium sp. URHD0025]